MLLRESSPVQTGTTGPVATALKADATGVFNPQTEAIAMYLCEA